MVIWKSTPLVALPDGQGWWVLQSIIASPAGQRWRIFHLSWGRDADEAARNYDLDAAELEKSLIGAAMAQGDIEDESEWEPPSTLVEHERIVRVKTLRDVKRIDRGLADMLREHEGFALEIESNGPTVIGGGFYEL